MDAEKGRTVTAKILITIVWSVCFFLVNVGAKKLARVLILDKGVAEAVSSAVYYPWTYLVLVLYVMCAALYMLLLRLMPISAAGPLTLSLGIVIVTLTGAIIFREDILDIWQITGIVFCILGIVFLQGGVR